MGVLEQEKSGSRSSASGAAGAAAREATDPRIKRWTRLLSKAEKDPFSVLEDKRCLRPHFVERFFDLCDAKALEAPWVAPDFAQAAFEIALKTRDPHQVLRAVGITVHTFISLQVWDKAAWLLEEFRQEAFGCCPACKSDWLRRKGDLLVETRDPEGAREYLEQAAEALGDEMDDQARAHILFVRGIAYFALDDVDRGVDDMGTALELFALSTQKAYFIEAIALMACFLEHTEERRHFEAALEHLQRFRGRLRKLKYWKEVRDRLRWAMGQIEARLGRYRTARPLLATARKNTAKHSPHRYALAIGLDEALLFCRNTPETHIHSIRRILLWCARTLKLEEALRQGLEEAIENLDEDPFYARHVLWDLRRSYVVPVPCLVGWLWSASELRRFAAEDADGGSLPDVC